jgi:transposase
MAASKLPMRKLRDVLRLHYDAGLTHRAIAQACAIGLGTVTAYLQRATAAGLTWPVPADLYDVALEARVFARPAPAVARERYVPDWLQLHHELKKPGVTLMLLWQEYRAAHPSGYAYSQFCERYRQWAQRLKPSMRQVHRAGEKLFVDFSGTRPHLVDAWTGEAIGVELFVGVLGASGLIYAEATATQDLPSWIDAHVRMVEYCHGSTAIWGHSSTTVSLERLTRARERIRRPFVAVGR